MSLCFGAHKTPAEVQKETSTPFAEVREFHFTLEALSVHLKVIDESAKKKTVEEGSLP